MGVSHSPAELGRKFVSLARSVEQRQQRATAAGAAIIEREVRGRVRSATGGDLILSGTNRTTGSKRSAKPGAKRIDVRAERSKASTGTVVRMIGPAQLVENDVAKHIVTSRYVKGAGYTRVNAKGKTVKGRTTRQSRQASVAFGLGAAGGGRRAVLHWGNNWARYTTASSKGRHPWRDGVAVSRQKASRAVVAEEAKAIVETFR